MTREEEESERIGPEKYGGINGGLSQKTNSVYIWRQLKMTWKKYHSKMPFE